jgi:hypothetical protein
MKRNNFDNITQELLVLKPEKLHSVIHVVRAAYKAMNGFDIFFDSPEEAGTKLIVRKKRKYTRRKKVKKVQ